jgi:hypothetical protein
MKERGLAPRDGLVAGTGKAHRPAGRHHTNIARSGVALPEKGQF